MVEDLTEGDGGCRRVGEKAGGCLGHLPELVGGEVGGGPGQERGHVQPSQRGHVQAVESCEPPLSPAGQSRPQDSRASADTRTDALARCWLGPVLPAVGHLVRQTHPALRAVCGGAFQHHYPPEHTFALPSGRSHLWIRSSTATAGLPSRDKRLLQRDQRLLTWGLRSLLPRGYGCRMETKASQPQGTHQHRRRVLPLDRNDCKGATDDRIQPRYRARLTNENLRRADVC